MTPFLGAIHMAGFNFAPNGWALCNGQLMPINQNQALFSLLGTFYGGDGRVTFALPDLQSRSPMHQGQGPGLSNHVLGEKAGAEAVTLLTTQIPAHTHAVTVNCSNAGGTANDPTGKVWSKDLGTKSATYSGAAASGTMRADAMAASNAGGGQAHENRQPFLVINFFIALQGIFPSRN